MIRLKDLLNEAFAANSKLAKALDLYKRTAPIVHDDKPEILAAMQQVKDSGLKSDDIFSFASLFKTNTFKIEFIRNGILEDQIKRGYLPGEPADKILAKARALKAFLIAFDNLYKTKTWYNDFR